MDGFQVLPVSPVFVEESGGEVESGYRDADLSPLLLSLLLPDLTAEGSQTGDKV